MSNLISVEHHKICCVVFRDRIYLSLHGISLICYTGPYHQCFHQKNSGLQFQLSCKVHNCKVSFKCCSHGRWCVPHRSIHRVNILEFLSRDKWFVLRNCCWEGGKKKPTLFYYSKVHFNLHKLHCVCDGLHERKHYSPASLARKKNREIPGGLKKTYCSAEF